MRKFLIGFFDLYQQQLYTAALFVVTGVLLVALLPHQMKFPYEFHEGQVWQHPDFIAPFDLPLEKNPADLAKERQAIEKQKNWYFKAQPSKNQVLPSGLEKAILAWVYEALLTETAAQNLQRNILEVLQAGILEAPPKGPLSPSATIFVQTGDQIEWRLAGDFYTVAGAHQQILKTAGIQNIAPQLDALLATALVPNIKVDAEKTAEKLQALLAEVSLMRGVVAKGSVIIRYGHYIDASTYNQLKAFQESYESGKVSRQKNFLIISGQAILIGVLLAVLLLFLAQNRPQILEDPANLMFVLFNILFVFGLASMVVYINPAYIYITPFPILPIVLRSFFDTRVALFVHMIAALIVGLIAPNSFEFIMLQFATGMFSIVTISGLYKRGQIFLAAFQISLIYILVYVGFSLFKEVRLDLDTLEAVLHFSLNGLLCLFAFPLIYIFERVFGLTSDITLLELSDTNNPLLRELAEKAPGTFQHSLQVANLAESAVLAIKGKPLLVRTGALYHDIGKMHNPLYFIENQTTGVNPHDELSYKESAEIITNHVKKGIELAKVHHLPEKVIDFIRTHHGTSTVQYFYRQYLSNFPDDQEARDEFAYPGPKPFSKETAVLMMADSVEAASRSLKRPNEEALSKLVDRIIDHQLADKQLENADITLREVALVKQILKKKLLNIYHLRVEYPR